jgi:hypothetical protein
VVLVGGDRLREIDREDVGAQKQPRLQRIEQQRAASCPGAGHAVEAPATQPFFEAISQAVAARQISRRDGSEWKRHCSSSPRFKPGHDFAPAPLQPPAGLERTEFMI